MRDTDAYMRIRRRRDGVYDFEGYLIHHTDNSGPSTSVSDRGPLALGPVYIRCGTRRYAHAVAERVTSLGGLTAEDDHWTLDMPEPPRPTSVRASVSRGAASGRIAPHTSTWQRPQWCQ